MSSGISKGSYTSIIASASLAVEGVIRLREGNNPTELSPQEQHTINGNSPEITSPPTKTVISLCRPPGHHCDTKMAGGYCYINNAVVAVEALNHLHHKPTSLKKAASSTKNDQRDPKIAILDIDFHHGNGTQDYFYTSSKVQYTSLHGENEYPYYSGHKSETGISHGLGYNFNYPLPTRSSAALYLQTLDKAVSNIETFEPEYLIVCLGFDTFFLDPLGGFGLETKDYAGIAGLIRGRLRMDCLVLLEGGYVIEDLGANLLAFVQGWEEG